MRHAARIVASALVVCVAAPSCDDTPSGRELRVEIVGTDGHSAVAAGDVTQIRIVVRQGDAMSETVESAVTGGTFSLSLPITDTSLPIRIVAELTGPSLRLVGALPAFVADETSGTVRIVVGPPGRCEVVYDASLRAARAGADVATLGTFALVAGGEAPAATAHTIEFFDLLVQRSSSEVIPLGAALGETHVARLTDRRALVVGASDAALVVDLGLPSTPTRPLSLHTGAGARSATVSVGERGAVVIGGETSGAPIDDVSWVSSDGTVSTSHLVTPRHDAAAVAVGELVLVSGGAAPGAPPIEWLDAISHDAHAVEPAVDDLVRLGAALSVSPDATRAYVFGGTGVAGPRSDALAFGLCPTPCSVMPPAAWPGPLPPGAGRPVSTPRGTLIAPRGEPGDALQGIIWSADGPHADVRPFETARTAAAATELAGGIVLVFGGSDGTSPRTDVELCFPADVALP